MLRDFTNSERSLLSRYTILLADESSVDPGKVAFNGEIQLGLKANRHIAAGQYILGASSSLSSDSVGDRPGVSIVFSPDGRNPRLILGPFRLVNHDCDPNAQVRPLSNHHPFHPIEPNAMEHRSVLSRGRTHTRY
jgi:hypothetical protein